jgi:hypothetical protein
MSSIISDGDTYHGISVFGRGVFKHGRRTYAGQCKDGHACGLGVLTTSFGSKIYAEHGPDGQCDGRNLWRFANGDTNYRLYERGKRKDYVLVYADGFCKYNGEDCAPDDPRLLALIAQVAPVEVRPAARAPHLPLAPKPSSDGSAGSSLPPQALAAAVATEVHPNAARRRWCLCDTTQQQQSTTTQRRVCGPGGRRGRTGGPLLHPNYSQPAAHEASLMQRRCHAIDAARCTSPLPCHS